jgi:hypothetical protein
MRHRMHRPMIAFDRPPRRCHKMFMSCYRKLGIAFLAFFSIFAAAAIHAPTASAAGACGGGSNLDQMMSGWNRLGVLDDVARKTGQSPGLDGSSREIVRDGVVATRVLHGGWVTNSTCSNGTFVRLDRPKHIPAGSLYFVPERLAPKPCEKGRVEFGWEASCGNGQWGNLVVQRLDCPPRRPSAPAKVPVTVLKKTRGGSGTFTIQWRVGQRGQWKSKRVHSGKRYRLTSVKRGIAVWLRESKVPSGWKLLSAKLMKKRANSRSLNFVVVNQKQSKPAPKSTAPSCEQRGGKFADEQQNCVVNDQDLTAKQRCEADGNIWRNNQCIVVQNSCGNVIIGDNNTVNGDNCSNREENTCTSNGGSWHNNVCTSKEENECVATGGSWYNNICNRPPPPPEERRVCPPGTTGEYPNCKVPQCPPGTEGRYPDCKVPKPPVSAECVNLKVEPSLTSNLTVDAVVTYRQQNTTLSSVRYFWGYNDRTTVNGPVTSFTYPRAGTYTVYAVLTFENDHDDGKTSATCAAKVVTPKDGTPGPGTGIPSQPGGPGAGGEPGPDPGTGESCRLPDGSVGYKDQFGHCNEYPLAA